MRRPRLIIITLLYQLFKMYVHCICTFISVGYLCLRKCVNKSVLNIVYHDLMILLECVNTSGVSLGILRY